MLEEAILDALHGHGNNRIIVTMPPRHGKSEYISNWLPVWYLGTYPDNRVILASYAAEYASSWGAKVRDNLRSEGWRFGIKVSNQSSSFVKIDNHSGSLTTAGVGGPITGKGADLFIIDDPVKNAEEALSETYRNKAWDWWESVAYTRLEPNAVVVLLMTRWHGDDLAGRLIELSGEDGRDEWKVINLPALAEAGDPLGRKEGEALWSARWSQAELEKKRAGMKDFWWQAMYQQRPIAEGKSIYKGDWWKYYTHTPENVADIVERSIHVFQSYDTAFKAQSINDYSVGQTWALMPNLDIYLLDLWRDRVEFPQLLDRSYAWLKVWQPSRVVIEDKASGQSLIQMMRNDKIPVSAMPADGDLIFRSHLVTGIIEAGRVYIPAGAPFTEDFLKEHNLFPYAAHDDIIASTVVALEYVQSVARTDRRASNGSSGGGRGRRERGTSRRNSITDLY